MLISWVRPGVFDTRASCFWLASALMSDDLPTLERPTNATSTSLSGSWCVRVRRRDESQRQWSTRHGSECTGRSNSTDARAVDALPCRAAAR